MSMFTCESYFYNQKKTNRFVQRRLRVIDDSYSFFGGDRGTVTFRGKQDADTESTAPRPKLIRRPSTGILRPGSARSRQVTVAPTATILPPVDPTGPKLITSEELPAEIRHTDEKLEFLEEVEKKQTLLQRKKTDWNINEAKFASSSILSRLSKFLYLVSEDFEVTLSLELVDELNRQYDHLVEDTVVARRQWQTDCYLDFKVKNQQPFLTAAPEDKRVRDNANAVIGKIVHKQQNEREKRVKLKQKPIIKKRMSGSPERPMTARSVMSNYSFKSDLSQPSDDGRESRNDYDLLPAELRPTILHYRRESSTPKMKVVRTSTATRLEKTRKLKGLNPVSPRSKKKKTKFQDEEPLEQVTEEELAEKATEAAGIAEKVENDIRFKLSAPLNEDWIVVPGDSEDPEANTIRMWERQLKELMRHREEEKMIAKQKGEDGPLFIKFYNDPRMRTLRTKGHQRAATFPMPSVFSKLPPSIASFSTPAPNDALLIGEGLTVFVLTLPDGSGYCNYSSGRVAISMSRHNSVGRGLYTLIYEDSEESPMIAYFTPSGKGCCYHHNGGLRVLFNREGGSLFDEDGYTTRKWTWPADGLNLPVAVNIQINANMSLRCTSFASITLRFSCRGQSHKFSISPTDAFNQMVDFTEGKMQSDAQFLLISKVAMDHMEQVEAASDVTKDGSKTKLQKRKSKEKASGPLPSEDDEGQQTLSEKPARELAAYRERIRSVVENWMDHYRECIGIALPKRLLSSSRRQSPPDASCSRDLSSSQSFRRQARTSMGFYPESSSRPGSRQGKHARSYTHPFPTPSSSRSPSPILQFGSPALKTRTTSTPAAMLSQRSHSISPLRRSQTMSSPDHVKGVVSREMLKPFKTGISKPKPKPMRSFTGCPIGFQSMILKNLESIPPCKCDKRRIPYISDLEYDRFLVEQIPKSQLVVICVVSSVVESSCPCEPMLDAIYCTLNRHRFSPCNQCSRDEYRLLKYDVCQAAKGLQLTNPLLIERHNATPGTFLMYMGGNLVFADRVFNGYGTAKKDFLKQVQMSISDGRAGSFLPDDFKLSHRNGGRMQSKNSWAYPVSGVMQDLIPFSPESGSGSTSRHSTLDVTDSRLDESFTENTFANMSYGGNYLQLTTYFNQSESRSQSRVSLLEASQPGSVTSVGGY